MSLNSDHPNAMAPPPGMDYRSPKELPFELVQHVGIFFEENLYARGLSLLFNTLASGTYASKHAIIPTPQHIALAATFLVHPSTTTRAKSAEEKEAASAALRLLRLLSTLVTPENCELNQAYAFIERSSRSGRRYHADEDDAGIPPEKALHLEMSRSDSLWSKAEDFWHAVGWAFNCSVLHPERWERWKVWLRYMCDIMQDDWDVRVKQYSKTEAKKAAGDAEETEQPADSPRSFRKQRADDGLDVFRNSLLFQYIAAGSSGPNSGRNRRIIRAIFADGSTKSTNEFRQVFQKELKSKSKKTPEKPKKREREVNIDEEEYGDYLAQDETEDEGAADSSYPPSRAESPTRRSKRTRRGTRTGPNAVTAQTAEASLPHHSVGLAPMGGLEALGLRKRLLGMLSNVSEQLPRDFIEWYDLYDLFVENVRPLPLPIFQAMVNPYVLPDLSDSAQSTLCEKLLLSLREHRAPNSKYEYLNQSKLEECFLPYAAASNSVVNNVKISILLEAVIQLLANSNLLTMTPSFKQAVTMGIEHRADRAQDEVRRNQSSRDKEPVEWCWLLESGERLMFLVEILSEQGT